MKSNVKNIIANNCYMLKYIFKYTPGLIVFIVLLKGISAIASILGNVYTLKFIVDSFQNNRPLKQVILYLVLYLSFSIFVLVINAVYTEVYLPKQKQILAKTMQTEMYRKAITIDLASYDEPSFYNDFIWAMSESDSRVLQVLESTGILIESIVSIMGVGALILSLDSLGVSFAIISCVASMLVNLKKNKITYNQDIEVRGVQRKRDYTNRVLYLADYAKEVRLSNVSDKLISDFKSTNTNLIRTIMKYSKKLLLLDLVVFVFSDMILLNGVYMLFLSYKALVLQVLSYGAVVGLINGVNNLQKNIFNVAEQFPKFYQYSIYIDKFKKFMNYECKILDSIAGKDAPSQNPAIEMRNVSFTYEGCEKATLKDINLTISPGEKIALVGYNGAGKSTLIKLIMRLYDVSQGKIIVNGEDIRDYRLNKYRNMFGVVFQDYKVFAVNLAENVEMDIFDGNNQKVEEALFKSGFEIKLTELSDGIFTPLTQEFSKKGVSLSGGELQKIAISRVFAKECNIVVLDEPSSALDPISEYEINKSMLNAAENKTVIFISHRLSTTMLADKIYMLENGRIVEAGNHKELMKLNGKYAQMFNMQAEKYLQK